MYPVRFGVFLPTGDVNEAMAAALRAERDGLYSVSTNDHFFSPLGTPQTPQNECFKSTHSLELNSRDDGCI